MGFFDELGSLLGEVTSIGDDLKQSASDAVQGITESTDQLASIKDEVLGELEGTTDKTDSTGE